VKENKSEVIFQWHLPQRMVIVSTKPYFQPYFPNKTTLAAQNHQKTNLITLLNKEEQ
jgi:hypothetical protein